MKIIDDLFKEKGKWSQGRVYLFWSIVAYYATLFILTLTGISKKHSNIDLDNFKIVIGALEYAMVLFAGYVFGGKILNVVKLFKNFKPEEEEKTDTRQIL